MTSWGISFISLALVAGMTSYLGLSNKEGNNQAKSTGQNANQPAFNQNESGQDSFGDSSNGNAGGFDNGSSFGDQSTDQNSQPFFNGDHSQQDQNQFSGRHFSHQNRFDTTTGGT